MSTLNKTNPKKWAERRIPCFAGTGDHTPQQNYYVGKPSFVGKGLDPFRKIQRAEFQKTVRYDNRPPLIKTERRKTVHYAIVYHIKTERCIPCFAGTGDRSLRDHPPQVNGAGPLITKSMRTITPSINPPAPAYKEGLLAAAWREILPSGSGRSRYPPGHFAPG